MPIYLFSKKNNTWNKISKKIDTAKKIVLFLDYDGTLTPIRSAPSSATISRETINLLNKLTALPQVQIYIVSGRAMKDIRKLVPIKKIFFIANHGFHILYNGKKWIHPKAQSVSQKLHRLAQILKRTLKPFKRSFVENKQFTLSIHYRQIPKNNTDRFITMAMSTISAYDSNLIVTRGKKVIEVRPPVKWGKGDAVLKSLTSNTKPVLTICIGDDVTDEDVFEKMRSKSITIRVGKSIYTFAKYYVKNVNEVFYLLKYIAINKNRQKDTKTKRRK